MNYNQRVASRQSACPDEGEFDFVVNQVQLFSIAGPYVQLEGTRHVTQTIFYTLSSVHITNIYEVTDEPHAHKYESFPAHSTVSDEELSDKCFSYS
jgi:hypothetical protein